MLVLSGIGVALVFPWSAPLVDAIDPFVGLFAVLAYYAGFAPPFWLRRYWQLSEMPRFLRQTVSRGLENRLRPRWIGCAR